MRKHVAPTLALTALSMGIFVGCGQAEDTAALVPFLKGKPVKISSLALPSLPPIQLSAATSDQGDNNCTDGNDCGSVNQKQNQNLVGNRDVANGRNTITGNGNIVADNGSVINIINHGPFCGCPLHANPSPGPSTTPSPTPTATPAPP